MEVYSSCSGADEMSEAERTWIRKCREDDEKLRNIGKELLDVRSFYHLYFFYIFMEMFLAFMIE